MALPFRNRAGVAVVDVHGAIGPKIKISAYERLFDSIALNKRYRALLLDIDSPGGTASGSEVLYYSLQRVAARKPVVAYVRGIGASGAYYMCCAASKVVALPSALVGSIGVIYLRPIMEQLLGKVGVEFSVFKAGRLKDMSGFWRHPTDEESGKLQELISHTYDLFVSVVTDSRQLTDEQVRELATGELFSAQSAQEHRLIDRQGGFNEAVAEAIRLSGARRRLKRLRPKRPFMERFTPFGRTGSQWSALAALAPLAAGGLYFMEPGFVGHGLTGSDRV
jgi:protease-4